MYFLISVAYHRGLHYIFLKLVGFVQLLLSLVDIIILAEYHYSRTLIPGCNYNIRTLSEFSQCFPLARQEIVITMLLINVAELAFHVCPDMFDVYFLLYIPLGGIHVVGGQT